MKTRIVHTKIWDDTWFQSLPRASSRLFLYIITCPDINICGGFELPDRKIMFHTGLNASELEQAKKDLSPKIIFYKDWVLVKNIDKFNSYKGSKNDVAREREIKFLPEKMRQYIRGIDTSIDTSIDTTLNLNHNQKSKSEIKNKKKEKNNFSNIDSLTDEFCKEVADGYNVSLRTVLELRDDLILYCRSKGKTYKDYRAALQTWLRKRKKEENAKTR